MCNLVPCHAGFEMQYSVYITCLENDATQCGGIQVLRSGFPQNHGI